MANTLLEVQDIHVYYGAIHAIKGISFHVDEGEIVTLIGANGASKSSSLSAISGLVRPRSGDILFEGKSIIHTPPHLIVREGLALCPEGRHIFANLTVEENLQMGAYTRKSSEISEMLKKVYASFPRLEERRKQTGGTLSGGEQQMLAMGRAMMSKPRVMMLDEPSMGLAPILVSQIFDMIKELHRQGVTILLVEQNASMALDVADRAYVMETGRITMSGAAKDLLNDPAVKKAYLGS